MECQEDLGGEFCPFVSMFSGDLPDLWDWQCDYTMEAHPLRHSPPPRLPADHFFPCQDLLQDFCFMIDAGGGGDVEGCAEEDLAAGGWQEGTRGERSELDGGGGNKELERVNVTFEEVSRYFYVPITQAAKELNLGLTQLKKKCRELGIPRWPHRKMKSLQALIQNVQELGREEGEVGEAQVRRAIDMLERERKAMERVPGMQLDERTKRLRQACFKASFKKRRQRLNSKLHSCRPARTLHNDDQDEEAPTVLPASASASAFMKESMHRC